MSGNPTNANVWADADVYISTNLTPTLPATASTPFGGDWTFVGLLDGDAGIEESRSEDVKDHYAWGGLLVSTSRSKFKLVRKFTVLEDNAMTKSLIWPGSTSSTIVVPRPAKVMIAFETRSGGKVKRAFSSGYAQIEPDGAQTWNETEIAKVTLAATIYPDSTGKLFDTQDVPVISSIAITPLTLSVVIAGASIKKLAATATYSDASTGDVTDQATWISSATAKATASRGYVTAVAAGTSNVSCVYGGVTSTAPCVVTVT